MLKLFANFQTSVLFEIQRTIEFSSVISFWNDYTSAIYIYSENSFAYTGPWQPESYEPKLVWLWIWFRMQHTMNTICRWVPNKHCSVDMVSHSQIYRCHHNMMWIKWARRSIHFYIFHFHFIELSLCTFSVPRYLFTWLGCERIFAWAWKKHSHFIWPEFTLYIFNGCQQYVRISIVKLPNKKCTFQRSPCTISVCALIKLKNQINLWDWKIPLAFAFSTLHQNLFMKRLYALKFVCVLLISAWSE